ncbi:MAG: FHA domain-containing protein [Prevotella sp.]
MQICPKCKQVIEDDSWFCDQCGTELMACPQCKSLRRGIRCNSCGTKLITAKDFSNSNIKLTNSTTPPSGSSHIQQGNVNTAYSANQTPFQQPVAGQNVESTIRPGASQQSGGRSLPRPDHLVCREFNLRLGVGDGAIIGRRGDYARAFAGQGYVSGTHARLQINTRGELEIVDLGSSNGTFVNGVQLTANVPKTICIGDTIKFANMQFSAEP